MLKYYYTKFGEVFSGWEFNEMEFPDYTIVIQGTKLRDYRELKQKEKTLEKISEYGWVLGNDVIVGVLNSSDFRPEIKHYQGDWWEGIYDRKYLFVFGAGASANCIFGSEQKTFKEDELRPPLGTGLFDRRFKKYYSKYQGVKDSLYFLQSDEGTDVEALFEKEWKDIYRHNNQSVMSRHINIQYYIQEVLKDVTTHVLENYTKNLYFALADHLQKVQSASRKEQYGKLSYKKFAFISFNQDTILDQALSRYFKKPLNVMKDYANYNDSPFCLFKPHGSWNWGWKFPDTNRFNQNTQKWLFDNEINFFQLYYELLGNHVNMIDWSTWGMQTMYNKYDLGKHTIDKSQLQLVDPKDLNSYYPGILLPYRDKDEFTMPLPHLDAMESYLGNVETLIIVGWKGNEEAFNKTLVRRGTAVKKIIIVDPNSKVPANNLKEFITSRNITPIYYKTFEDFVNNGMTKEII